MIISQVIASDMQLYIGNTINGLWYYTKDDVLHEYKNPNNLPIWIMIESLVWKCKLIQRVKPPKTNDGRSYCWWCGEPTIDLPMIRSVVQECPSKCEYI